MREKIEKFVTAWERKAKADMHLEALLAKSIKLTLIEGLTSIFEDEIAAKPLLTEKAIRSAVEDAKVGRIKPKPDGTYSVQQARKRKEKSA